MTRPLLTFLLVLVAATPAAAGTVTIGSDLSAEATVAIGHPNDWGAWNTALAGDRQVKVPVKGEVGTVRLKGSAAARGRDVVMHVQVVRPQGDGSVKAITTSADLPLPDGGVTTYDLQSFDARLCVEPGDYVALTTSGGGGADGVPFEVFGRSAGSAADVFLGDRGGANGDGQVFSGRTRDGLELLMQTEIDTGADARPFCRAASDGGGGGGGGGTPAGPVRLRVGKGSARPTVRDGRFRLRVSCAGKKACKGRVRVERGGKVLAARPVTVPGGRSAGVKMELTAAGLKLFRRQGRSLNATAKASSGGRTHQRAVRLHAPGVS